MTSETTWTDWTYDNSCVDWATNSKHNYVFTASSWFVLDDSWNNISYNCTYTVADSKALNENLVFCAGSQTDTIYWHNATYGWYNGNLSGYWQREADGPCAWTLGQYQDLRYDFQSGLEFSRRCGRGLSARERITPLQARQAGGFVESDCLLRHAGATRGYGRAGREYAAAAPSLLLHQEDVRVCELRRMVVHPAVLPRLWHDYSRTRYTQPCSKRSDHAHY